jgi:hypothetical protein
MSELAYRAKLSENRERQRKFARQRVDDIHAITHRLIEIKRKLATAGFQVALQDTNIQDRIAKPKLVRVIVAVSSVCLAGILFGQSDTMALVDGGPPYGRNLSGYSALGVIGADRSEQHRPRGPHLEDSNGLDERQPRDHSGRGLRQRRIAHDLNGYWPERPIEPGWRSAPGFGDNDYRRATSFDGKWHTEN